MARQPDTEWITAPSEGVDLDRFAERYGLAPGEYESFSLSGDQYIKVSSEIASRIGAAPIFDPPPAVVPMTREEYAELLATVILPNGTAKQRARVVDLLLKFSGDRPPDLKPDTGDYGAAAVFTLRPGKPYEQAGDEAALFTIVPGKPYEQAEPAARFTFMFEGKEVTMFNLTATQQVDVTLTITTAKGKPAQVDDPPVWSSSNEAVAAVVSAAGGMSATIKAVDGEGGVCQITAAGDADLGPGTKPLTGFLDVTVAPGAGGQAAVFELIPGTPTEQAA